MATFPVSIIPVKKGDTGFAVASGSVVVSGEATAAASGILSIGGLDVQIAVAKGATAEQVAAEIAAAVNAELNRPVTAAAEEATVTFTARWSGALGNRISLAWSGNAPGLTFAFTDFKGGAGVPAVDAALATIGEVWETFVLDTFDYKTADGGASLLLDVYQTWGEAGGACSKKARTCGARMHGRLCDAHGGDGFATVRQNQFPCGKRGKPRIAVRCWRAGLA